MSEATDAGKIVWIDITVDDAEGLRDFYAKVIGWQPEKVQMGDYADFNMTLPGSGEPAVGICHARGSNADLPPQWLIYIVVEDVAASAAACTDNGGEVVLPPRPLSGGSFCVIRDPAGAVAALFEPPMKPATS